MFSHSSTCVGFLYGFFLIGSFWGSLFSGFFFPFLYLTAPFLSLLFLRFSRCFRHPPSPFIPHLFSPFSFQLGTVSPNTHFFLCWNLWFFGHLVSLPLFRYSCQHSYFWSLFLSSYRFLSPLYRTLYYLESFLFLSTTASVTISASSIYGAIHLL